MSEPIVKLADCCKHCDHGKYEWTFKDAVLCNKSNKFQFLTNTCELFEMKKE